MKRLLADKALTLTSAYRMTLEDALKYIDNDLIEITLEFIRLRKKILEPACANNSQSQILEDEANRLS